MRYKLICHSAKLSASVLVVGIASTDKTTYAYLSSGDIHMNIAVAVRTGGGGRSEKVPSVARFEKGPNV